MSKRVKRVGVVMVIKDMGISMRFPIDTVLVKLLRIKVLVMGFKSSSAIL
jgi:hypothetical protein